jgi:putative glutamine amidotransferase
MAVLPTDSEAGQPLRTPLRVALTTTVDTAGSHARPAVVLYNSYIHALEQVGLAPVLITPAHSPGSIAALLDACAGLVLSGGEDVDPSRYGESPSPALGTVEPLRDAMEFCALALAEERGVPILGICRGLQVLNVHFGGTLYQDIATERPSDLLHQQREPWGHRSHGASVRPGSMLHRIAREERLHINSFHHQAVKHLGRGLVVTSRADDGLVEAIEHERHPWLLGVQWHPERNEAAAPDGDPDRRIFLAFRTAVQEYARRGEAAVNGYSADRDDGAGAGSGADAESRADAVSGADTESGVTGGRAAGG